jgi:23S rRNA pseudouridine1911/1915/1917 synthase
MKLVYQVPEKTPYQTIKEVLKIEFSISDRLLLKLKKLQRIYLNEQIVYVHHPIQKGDIIQCDLEYEEDNSNIVPTPLPLSIVYEDEGYLVIDKPVGIPIHPSCGHYTDSLSNRVRSYFNQIGLKKKIRPVNRLDKDTSGLVIFAKNEYIQECLVRQMQTKEFVKKYIAFVNGHLENPKGTIQAPIARRENSIIERCVSLNGDIAITHYQVLTSKEMKEIFQYKSPNITDDFDIVECTLETGRTHQIRVHMAHIGNSLLGDTLYGVSSPLISRQALHCYNMKFIHPITKQKVIYKSNLPEDMITIIQSTTLL